jgi:hypothetical protein
VDEDINGWVYNNLAWQWNGEHGWLLGIIVALTIVAMYGEEFQGRSASTVLDRSFSFDSIVFPSQPVPARVRGCNMPSINES